jgi:TonB family protein
MPARFGLLATAFVLVVMVAGCASPPNADVEAAKGALANATAADAGQYAPESLKAARDAQAALDAELQAQDAKWIKSYDRSKELAATAKAAGEKAAADAASGKATADAAAAAVAAKAAAKANAVKTAVRVGGQVKPPTKIKDVQPVYPSMARTAGVSGTVGIEATIGADGKIVDARVVKSIPLLDDAALNAVRQWEYTPSTLNGVAVPVVVTVTINFKR